MDFFVKYAPTIATIFFFLIFCYILFYALRKKNKKKFEDYSQIPLKNYEKSDNLKIKKEI